MYNYTMTYLQEIAENINKKINTLNMKLTQKGLVPMMLIENIERYDSNELMLLVNLKHNLLKMNLEIIEEEF